jgi:light-regulated signal transduction histidine kinase (bacteriophytochrome)
MRETVDVSALAEAVLSEQAAQEPERAVRWTSEPGLAELGDRRMIEVALTNNAWKYTSRKPDATIAVASQEEDGRCWICVEDNGAGFDPRCASHLFQPFERLHIQDDFPGVGIGLATVQCIVHPHGGEVRATGSPGEGAKSCSTLPLGSGTRDT